MKRTQVLLSLLLVVNLVISPFLPAVNAQVVEEPEPIPEEGITCILNVSPSTIQAGESVLLTWDSIEAVSGEITPNIGEVPSSGSLSVNPIETTTYIGTFTDGISVTDCSATIFVGEEPPVDEEDPTPESGLILGCTDPGAANFNPVATQDDGSCDYGGGLGGTPTSTDPVGDDEPSDPGDTSTSTGGVGDDITYYFSGYTFPGFGSDLLPEETPFCGSFTYDGTQTLNTPTHPYMGMYELNDLELTIGDNVLSDERLGPTSLIVFDHDESGGYPPEPEAAEEDKRITGYPFDLITLSGQMAGVLEGVDLSSFDDIRVDLRFLDQTGKAYDSPAVPDSNLSTSDFLPEGNMSISLSLMNFDNPDPSMIDGDITTLSLSPIPSCTIAPAPVCSDGLDNDADGLVDYPADPGCVGPSDTDEANETTGDTKTGDFTILDDATGGNCSEIGSWDLGTKTCTLTNDISGRIDIASDGVTLDGNNHVLDSVGQCTAGVKSSMLLQSVENVIVKGLRFEQGCEYGVEVQSGTNVTIQDNEFIIGEDIGSNMFAVYVHNASPGPRSNDINIIGNSFDGSGKDTGKYAILVQPAEELEITWNTVLNYTSIIAKDLVGDYYISNNELTNSGITFSGVNESNRGHINYNTLHTTGGDNIFGDKVYNSVIKENQITGTPSYSAGTIRLTNVADTVISDNSLSFSNGNNALGIFMGAATGNQVLGNTVERAHGAGAYGILIDGTQNYVADNTIVDSGIGIDLRGDNNYFLRNNIADHNYGIKIQSPGVNEGISNYFVENQITGATYGVAIYGDSNKFTNNTISGNVGGANYGVIIDDGYNTFDGDLIEGFAHGFHFEGSAHHNKILNTTINETSEAIYMLGGHHNEVRDSYITNTARHPLLIPDNSNYRMDSNVFVHNNFINYGIKPYQFYGGTHVPAETNWGTLDGGNYWSGYDSAVEGCVDGNNDRVCDTMYRFDTNTGHSYQGQIGDYKPYTVENGWLASQVNQPPAITVDPETVNIEIGDSYTEEDKLNGITVSDPDGPAIPLSQVFVSGLVNTDQAGQYTLTYTVEDSLGAPAEAERTVIVNEPGSTDSTKFTTGDRVEVIDGPLNVRSSAGGSVLGLQTIGYLGTVLSGPVFVNDFWWWNINYDSGVDGWSAEDFIEKTTESEGPDSDPTECSDGIDNDGDQRVDGNDPGCHSDGNASNDNSYDPNINSEVHTNRPPLVPTGLRQANLYGPIGVGDLLNPDDVEPIANLSGTVSDPDGDNVFLEVAISTTEECPVGQLCVVAIVESSPTFSENTAFAYAELESGPYRWIARAVDEKGAKSEWVQFGGNDEYDLDFLVQRDVKLTFSPLRIYSSSSFEPYIVGNYLFAEFTVNNPNSFPVTLDWLQLKDEYGYFRDQGFDVFENILLGPGESFDYRGDAFLSEPGPQLLSIYSEPAIDPTEDRFQVGVDLGDSTTYEQQDVDEYLSEGILVTEPTQNEKPIPSAVSEVQGLLSGLLDGRYVEITKIVQFPSTDAILVVVRHKDCLSLCSGYSDKLFKIAGDDVVELNTPSVDVGISATAIAPTDENVLYIGSSGDEGVYMSSNGGKSWNYIDAPKVGSLNLPITSLAVDEADPRIIYAGTTDGLWKQTSTHPWEKIYDHYVYSVVTSSEYSDVVYAVQLKENVAGIHTTLIRSKNGGVTWDEKVNSAGVVQLIDIDDSLNEQALVSIGLDFRMFYIPGVDTDADGTEFIMPFPSRIGILAHTGLYTDWEAFDSWSWMKTEVREDGQSTYERWQAPNSISVHPKNKNLIFVSYPTRGVYFSPNSGENWFPFGFEGVLLEGASFSSDGTYYVYTDTKLYSVDIEDTAVIAKINSPGELRVRDKNGNLTGLVDGVAVNQIAGAVYDEDNHSVYLFQPQSGLTYEVVGFEQGYYGLDLRTYSDGEVNSFHAENIELTDNEIHEYVVNWEALEQGNGGVQVTIDDEGDGVIDAQFEVGPDLSDSGAPETSFKLNGKLVDIQKYIDDVSVVLNAVDDENGSGIMKMEYSFNNEDWEEYIGTTTINEDGEYTIYYRSTDWFGNVEETKSVAFEIVSTQGLIEETLAWAEDNNSHRKLLNMLRNALKTQFWSDRNTVVGDGVESVPDLINNAIKFIGEESEYYSERLELAKQILESQ